ncbi:MAG: permease [Spirochaetales bacterium]|nr:permease [Spirochaetales bacterium]
MSKIFSVFTMLADWLVYGLFRLDPSSKLGDSVHFFIEDITKIFVLLIVMIYLISLARASLDTEKVRNFLHGKNRFFAYFLASLFGAITPFCSCSSIPLFLGFTAAGIPLGVTMAFLITSPMINEVAVVLLGAGLGLKFTIVYVATGIVAGMAGGFFIDLIKAERFLMPIGHQALEMAEKTKGGDGQIIAKEKLTFKQRHKFAVGELGFIVKKVSLWIVAGVGIGAAFHGFVPEEWVVEHLGKNEFLSVPVAVVMAIPLYANVTGIIPIAESMIGKGVPIGTVMAFMMGVVGASLPEFMMLKKVMKVKLLLIIFAMFLVFFTLAGWFFNLVF